MAQQTAVEWLFEKLWDEPKDKFTWYALREKAIQMEKEQLDNARPQIVSNCVIKEISNEEIEKAWSIVETTHVDKWVSFKSMFIEGAKWYKEQLKKK
jgi:hypothetical protein